MTEEKEAKRIAEERAKKEAELETLKAEEELDNIIIRKAKHTVELCAIYWHFLLAVWIVLFGLMLFS